MECVVRHMHRRNGESDEHVDADRFAPRRRSSMAGTVVEWYEFFLYGTAATLVFNKIFFSEATSDLNAIFLAFATYAVGFIARPVGGVVFGHYGDKFGRKKLLQFSLILVGAATFLMGCLPTFGQIGYWAPGLLVALRFIQGFAVGGEWGGAILLVAEHSPDRQRGGFWASWPQAGVPMGNLLATIVLLVLTGTLSDAAFLSWGGWRVAFWLSAVVVLIGYYIRTKVTDAPIFVEAQREAERIKASSYSVVEVLKRYPPRRLHRDGSALRREHHVLPGGHVLHHLSEGSGGRRHQFDPLVLARRARGALRRRAVGRAPVGPARPQARLHGGCGPRRLLGVLRLSHDEQRQLRRRDRRGDDRLGLPCFMYSPAAGHHGRDVPPPGCGIPVSPLVIR